MSLNKNLNDSKRSISIPAQKQEILNSIKTKNEIPHKFAYLDMGADVWDAISKDPNYDLGKRELSTLKKLMRLVCAKMENERYNVLHIGPGNGVEIPIIVDGLGVHLIINYALTDISPELLKMARSYGNEHSKNLKFLSFIHDGIKLNISEIAENIRRKGSNKNLILLIANGAILSNSPVLTNVRRSMMPEDKLLITLESYSTDREKEILEQYKLPAIINLFAKCLSHIGIHDPVPEQFEFLYNRKDSMIEVYFLVEKWLKSHSTTNIQLNTPCPNKIKVFSSLRPTASELQKILTAQGFEILIFHHYMEEKCCGVLCGV
ncbi:hypothetical protein C5S53_14335 [Methanophagales archaeon]|nr:hypothetical protein C5S53_14335 [Methanophagales archaeon]